LELITRRSRVQIPPPLRESPGQTCVWPGLLPSRRVALPSLLPGFLPAAGDEFLEDAGGLGLHAGQDMLVGVDGERRVGVAEAFGDDFDGYTFFD